MEGDLFLSTRSSFFFFLSLFLSFFFSRPDSCLKIKIFVVKSKVFGQSGGFQWGPGQGGGGNMKKKRKNEKMKEKIDKIEKIK